MDVHVHRIMKVVPSPKIVHTYIHIYIPWIHNFVTRQEDVE
jgi:hypothetical protein